MFWAHCTWKSYQPLLNIYLKKQVFLPYFLQKTRHDRCQHMSASSFTLSSLFALSSSFARRPGPTCQHSIDISTCWNPAERKNMKLLKYIYFFESLIYGWSSVVECSGKFETFPMIWFQKVKTPTWSEGFHLLRGLCRVTEGRWVRFDPLSNVKHENDNIYI